MRRKFVAGNWKMNGLRAGLNEVEAMIKGAPDGVEMAICPPATLIAQTAALTAGTPLRTGGQNCHAANSGAYTGDISADMLLDAGADCVILGHSERRDGYDESSEDVRAKAKTAIEAGLTTIICLGESEAQRDAENTLDIIGGQLAGSIPDAATAENLVVAYEPIWAIGTGRVPTLAQIKEVHDFIRARMIRRFGEDTGNAIRILYGGSVKPDNAREIFDVENVDGALVGGASLKASDFLAIANAAA